MYKNILSLTALASMASARRKYSKSTWSSFTVAELENMEQTGTPIRIDKDYWRYHSIKLELEKDNPLWHASVDESLPIFRLDGGIPDEDEDDTFTVIRWTVRSDSVQNS